MQPTFHSTSGLLRKLDRQLWLLKDDEARTQPTTKRRWLKERKFRGICTQDQALRTTIITMSWLQRLYGLLVSARLVTWIPDIISPKEHQTENGICLSPPLEVAITRYLVNDCSESSMKRISFAEIEWPETRGTGARDQNKINDPRLSRPTLCDIYIYIYWLNQQGKSSF